MTDVVLSALPHTWLVDIDGTILKHNANKTGGDELLTGVREFWASIPEVDVIILLSARTLEEMPATLKFLDAQRLRYNHAIFGIPRGERILINDKKPSGLNTAKAVNIRRDAGLNGWMVCIDESL
jgi:hypothetical protein